MKNSPQNLRSRFTAQKKDPANLRKRLEITEPGKQREQRVRNSDLSLR